jgi:hypothetical protein
LSTAAGADAALSLLTAYYNIGRFHATSLQIVQEKNSRRKHMDINPADVAQQSSAIPSALPL